MKINRRKLIVLGGGALASSVLSMPAIASSKKIKVGALRFTSHSASFIAKERGYFKQVGLDVEFEFFQAAQRTRRFMSSGMNWSRKNKRWSQWSQWRSYPSH